MSRLSFAALAAALAAAPAAAWEPAVVGLDVPAESAAPASVASAQVAAGTIQPHVVGIDDDADYVPAASTPPVEGMAAVARWEPEIVGLYSEEDLRAAQESLAARERDAELAARSAR